MCLNGRMSSCVFFLHYCMSLWRRKHGASRHLHFCSHQPRHVIWSTYVGSYLTDQAFYSSLSFNISVCSEGSKLHCVLPAVGGHYVPCPKESKNRTSYLLNFLSFTLLQCNEHACSHMSHMHSDFHTQLTTQRI